MFTFCCSFVTTDKTRNRVGGKTRKKTVFRRKKILVNLSDTSSFFAALYFPFLVPFRVSKGNDSFIAMSFNSMPVQRSRWFLYRIPLHSRPQRDINRVDMNSICQIASKYSLALPYLARLLRTKRLSSKTLKFVSVGLSMLRHFPASSYVLQACSKLRYGTKTHMGGYLHILRKHTTSSCVPRRIK